MRHRLTPSGVAVASGVVFIFAAFLAVAVAVVVFSYLAAKKRREAMVAYAAGRGWRFEAEQPLLVDRFTGPPFGLGSPSPLIRTRMPSSTPAGICTSVTTFLSVRPLPRQLGHGCFTCEPWP